MFIYMYVKKKSNNKALQIISVSMCIYRYMLPSTFHNNYGISFTGCRLPEISFEG